MSVTPTLRRILLSALPAALLAGTSIEAGAQLVVARVNGAPITNEQLDRGFDAVLRERKLHLARMQNPAQARDLKRLALDRLIKEELFWQQAQKEQLLPTAGEVDGAFEEAVAQARSRETFQLRLIRQGMDETAYRHQIRRLLAADRYAQRVVEQRVKIGDADIEAFYKGNPQLFDKPELWHVRTVAISSPTTQSVEQRRGARLRAEALRQEVAQGGDFDQLARRHSDDPTRQWGGALDAVPLADLPEWMQKPVARLQPGQLSPVIETMAGYHLLKLDRREAARSVPLDEARQGIRDYLLSSRGRDVLDQAAAELREQARIDLLVPL